MCCKIVYLLDCTLSLADCDSFVVVISPWLRFALVVTLHPLCPFTYSQSSTGGTTQSHVCANTFHVFIELRVNIMLT